MGTYYCVNCGVNVVENPGDVCELCAIGQDPYAASLQGPTRVIYGGQNNNNANTRQGGASSTSTYQPRSGAGRKVLIGGAATTNNAVANVDPYGNDMTVQDTGSSNVQVYRPGQAATTVQTPVPTQTQSQTQAIAKGGPETSGIIKNLVTDKEERSILVKIIRSIFLGAPFTLDNEVTSFQVFPDYTGTSMNAQGNACDQVVIYGKVTAGTVAENNQVEVYGKRDRSNNIVAKSIKNVASGTIVTPQGAISAAIIRILALIVIALLATVIMGLGGLSTSTIIWIIVGILCLTNLPLVIKILGAFIAMVFSIIGGLFRRH
ncbi:MAG: hypothetical protein IJ744_03635 [Lachnospiraceae bacterium]|nr:hypothetical protein [Lachnospiraceae bacterium]